MIKIKATTPSVVNRSDESIPPKAPKRSPRSAPTPVTFAVRPFAFPYAAASSRSVFIISGNTGFLLGSKSLAESKVSGRLTSKACLSWDAKANIG
ncbi:unannotated protein [freshwater metagenome]|uniref:Unannotated protein n=1 Tax=freshwater metagenome TaxID=449393 RepID=A0A6J6MEK5_9ZZZZ